MPTNLHESDRADRPMNGHSHAQHPPTYFYVCPNHGRLASAMSLEPFDSRSICPRCVADFFLHNFKVTKRTEE